MTFLLWLHVLLLLLSVAFLMVNCWNPATDKKKEKEKEKEREREKRKKKKDKELKAKPKQSVDTTPMTSPFTATSPFQATQKVESLEQKVAAPPPPPPPEPEPAPPAPVEEKEEPPKNEVEEDPFRCTDYTPETLRDQQPMFDLLEMH